MLSLGLSLTAFAADAPVEQTKCQMPGAHWASPHGGSMLFCSQQGVWRDISNATPLTFEVVVMRGAEKVTGAQIWTFDGSIGPVSMMQERPYKKESFKDKDGTVVSVPGTIRTGFTASIAPDIRNDGRISTEVNLSISELLGLNKVQTADGLEFELPDVDVASFKQILFFRSGDTIIQEIGKYTVKITAKRV
jgi:hypothetical protein